MEGRMSFLLRMDPELWKEREAGAEDLTNRDLAGLAAGATFE